MGPILRFTGWSEGTVVTLPAGSLTRLDSADGITLETGVLEIYRLTPDGRAVAGDVPAARTTIGGSSEGLVVPLPVEQGEWLASIYFHWATGCLAGDGFVDFQMRTSAG